MSTRRAPLLLETYRLDDAGLDGLTSGVHALEGVAEVAEAGAGQAPGVRADERDGGRSSTAHAIDSQCLLEATVDGHHHRVRGNKLVRHLRGGLHVAVRVELLERGNVAHTGLAHVGF